MSKTDLKELDKRIRARRTSDFRALKPLCANHGYELIKRSNGFLLSPANQKGMRDHERSYVELGSLETKPLHELCAAHARVIGPEEVRRWIARAPIVEAGAAA